MSFVLAVPFLPCARHSLALMGEQPLAGGPALLVR